MFILIYMFILVCIGPTLRRKESHDGTHIAASMMSVEVTVASV